MNRTAMSREKTIVEQMWKVGDSVVAIDTEFSLTKNKVYKILARGVFYDCLAIVNDEGKKEEYSEEYFELLVE